MDHPAPTQASSQLVLFGLSVILLMGAGLRWHGITQRGFFFDELWVTELSSGHGSEFLDLPTDRLIEQPNLISLSTARPIWQIPAHTTGAIHPPGTFLMLRLWRELFGDSILALRSFSATASVVVIGLTFWAARLSFGTIAGLSAAMLSALSPANIDQAQDVRGYTLLQAFFLLGAIALLRIRGKTSAPVGATLVGLATLAMMFTHYFSAGACTALGLGGLLLLRGRARWQTLAMLAITAVVWLVVWLPSLKAQLAYVPETADIFLLDRSANPLAATLLRSVASPYQALIADPRPLNGAALIGGVVIAALAVWRMLQANGQQTTRLFWLGVVAAVIGLLLGIDLARQSRCLEYPKYLLLANPALCVLLGSLELGRIRWIAPAAINLTAAVLLFLTPTAAKPDLRPQLAWLRERVQPDDVVLLPSSNPLGRDGQATYLYLAHGLPWAKQRIAIPVQTPPASFVASLPRNVRWFYLTFSAAHDPRQWLAGTRIIDAGPVGNAAAYELTPTEPTVPEFVPH